jgi:hypothetical protein
VKPNTALIASKRTDCRGIPSLVRTRGGVTFDPRTDIWSYRDGVKQVRVNFSLIAGLLSAEMLHSLKAVLVWYCKYSSPSSVINMYSRVLALAKCLTKDRPITIERVSAIDLLNYKITLGNDPTGYLGGLSSILKKWHGLGLPGVSEDAISLLRDLRLNGNTKGIAVQTMDPVLGPYTGIELESIQTALNDCFAAGAIAEDAYLLAWLFISLGQRPSQYAALKVSDISGMLIDGEVHYSLKVPRVKQRNAHPRVQLKTRQRFQGKLAEPNDAPMFPCAKKSAWAPGYKFHQTGQGLTKRLNDTLLSLRVYSERTGDLLHISPIRFRRTLGTRAAQEGHGELVIAEMLDHSDTQHVGSYVASVPEIAARIDRAMAMEMAPLAQAFKGALINNESEATRHGDPSSRILDLRIDRSMKPMGSCGQYSFCEFNAPIACYTCRSFEPWLDGPHEAVLNHLLEKREQLLVTTDTRMAAVNDRTILAVAEVIQLCRDAAVEVPHR